MRIKQVVKYENHKYIITTTAKNYYHTSSIAEGTAHDKIFETIHHDRKKCKEHLSFLKVCNQICKDKDKHVKRIERMFKRSKYELVA